MLYRQWQWGEINGLVHSNQCSFPVPKPEASVVGKMARGTWIKSLFSSEAHSGILCPSSLSQLSTLHKVVVRTKRKSSMCVLMTACFFAGVGGKDQGKDQGGMTVMDGKRKAVLKALGPSILWQLAGTKQSLEEVKTFPCSVCIGTILRFPFSSAL